MIVEQVKVNKTDSAQYVQDAHLKKIKFNQIKYVIVNVLRDHVLDGNSAEILHHLLFENRKHFTTTTIW